MCFRYASMAETNLSNWWLHLISIIWCWSTLKLLTFKNYTSRHDILLASIFRIGILNYFTDDLTIDHAATYVPTLLRLGGYLQTEEVTDKWRCCISSLMEQILLLLVNPWVLNMPLNPAECGSPTHTGMACRWFN